MAPKSYFFVNDGKGNFEDKIGELAGQLEYGGLITDVLNTDFNKDGKVDLVICGEWMSVGFYQQENGRFSNATAKVADPMKLGWWQSLKEYDYDNDGDLDIIAGNIGGNNKFHPAAHKPMKVYFRDFDNNGTEDIYLSVNYKGKEVPVRGRECSSEQMPFIADKYPTYSKFASAEITEILGVQNIDSSLVYEARDFEHNVFINDNNSYKKAVHLPSAAQMAPLRAAVLVDLNKDGKEDVLGVGNWKDTEVETAAYDAGFGFYGLNNNGELKALLPNESGLLLSGETRDIKLLKLANGKQLALISKFDEPMEAYILP